MDCQEFDKYIQAFIDREIDYSRLDDFIEHYKHCEDCHEELEINFLMAYVLKDDDMTTFNLSKELDRHIQTEMLKKEKYDKNNLFHAYGNNNSTGSILFSVLYRRLTAAGLTKKGTVKLCLRKKSF